MGCKIYNMSFFDKLDSLDNNVGIYQKAPVHSQVDNESGSRLEVHAGGFEEEWKGVNSFMFISFVHGQKRD